MWLLLLACAPTPPARALVDADRSAHWLARPTPSDELLNEVGAIDLSAMPLPGNALGDTLLEGWIAQAAEASFGFSPQTPIAFHLDGDPGLAHTYAGLPEDPVALFEAGRPERRLPVELTWVPEAGGDPYLLDGTLLVRPLPGRPLASGRTYIAALSAEVVAPAEGWEAPEGAGEGWGVATRFTVQDSARQALALQLALDEALAARPALLEPAPLREVVSVSFEQGSTPSGRAATRFTVTYADGGQAVTHLSPGEGLDRTIDLRDDLYLIYETQIQTLNFQGLADMPYTSPGPGFLLDGASRAGWMPFDAQATLSRAPEPEPVRVVIQVPRGGAAGPVLTWDHGTGGHAYNAVARRDPADDVQAVREALAAAGVVIVSHDLNLYGQRFDLIDGGYGGGPGFYNFVNLPAFRDNQRQLGVDHAVMTRFVQEVLPGLPEAEGVDPRRLGAFGHSLGTVSAHVGLAIEGGSGAEAALMSGVSAYFIYAVLETGLLVGEGSDLSDLLMALLDMELPEPVTGQTAAAALLGLPEDRLDTLDRFHPALLPFQTLVDPSDPLALTQRLSAPEWLLMGEGDRQTPNIGTRFFAEAHGDAEIVPCVARGDDDPHHCTWREPEGLEAFVRFVDGL